MTSSINNRKMAKRSTGVAALMIFALSLTACTSPNATNNATEKPHSTTQREESASPSIPETPLNSEPAPSSESDRVQNTYDIAETYVPRFTPETRRAVQHRVSPVPSVRYASTPAAPTTELTHDQLAAAAYAKLVAARAVLFEAQARLDAAQATAKRLASDADTNSTRLTNAQAKLNRAKAEYETAKKATDTAAAVAQAAVDQLAAISEANSETVAVYKAALADLANAKTNLTNATNAKTAADESLAHHTTTLTNLQNDLAHKTTAVTEANDNLSSALAAQTGAKNDVASARAALDAAKSLVTDAGIDWMHLTLAQKEDIIASLIGERLNVYRKAAGLDPIPMSVRFNKDAKRWSEYMAANNIFEHSDFGPAEYHQVLGNDPKGTPGTWVAGSMENIAMRSGWDEFDHETEEGVKESLAEVSELLFQQWVGSPGHNANMLSGNINIQSVGVKIREDGSIYATMQGYNIKTGDIQSPTFMPDNSGLNNEQFDTEADTLVNYTGAKYDSRGNKTEYTIKPEQKAGVYNTNTTENGNTSNLPRKTTGDSVAVAKAQAEYDAAKEKLSAADQTVADAQTTVDRANADKTAAENAVNTEKTAVEDAQAAADKAAANVNTASAAVDSAQAAADKAAANVDPAQQAAIDEAQAKVDAANAAANEARASEAAAQQAVTDAETEVASAQQAVDTTTAAQAAAAEDITDAEAAVNAARADVDAAQKAVDDLAK